MSKDLKDSAKEVGDKVEAAVEQGKEQLKDTTHKAQDNLHDLKNKADSHFSSFNDRAEDFAATAEDEFNRLYGQEGKLESLVNFVRDRPILSLGSAAIAGIILTKLLKSCCRKHR